MARGMVSEPTRRSSCVQQGSRFPSSDIYHDSRIVQVMDHDAPEQKTPMYDPKDDAVQPVGIFIPYVNGGTSGEPKQFGIPIEQYQYPPSYQKAPPTSTTQTPKSAAAVAAPSPVIAQNDQRRASSKRAHLFIEEGPMKADTADSPATPVQTETRKMAKPKVRQLRSRTRDRSLSAASTVQSFGNEDDGATDSQAVTVQTMTFHIADTKALKDYIRRRLHEIGLKPVRDILKEWIKIAEPRRLGLYGGYNRHGKDERGILINKTPAQDPNNRYPKWWPRDVLYREPSHLSWDDRANGNKGIETLFIAILLLHREPTDAGKMRINWTAELKKAAFRACDGTPADKFASGRFHEYNKAKKQVAMEQCLPDMFDVAQAYEDFFAQYGPNADVSLSRQHTWSTAQQPRKGQPFGTEFHVAGAKRTNEKRRRMTVDAEDDDLILDAPAMTPISVALPSPTEPHVKSATICRTPASMATDEVSPPVISSMNSLAIEPPSLNPSVPYQPMHSMQWTSNVPSFTQPPASFHLNNGTSDFLGRQLDNFSMSQYSMENCLPFAPITSANTSFSSSFNTDEAMSEASFHGLPHI